MLGRALLKLNRTDDAVKAFQAIAKDSKLAEAGESLGNLRAERCGNTVRLNNNTSSLTIPRCKR